AHQSGELGDGGVGADPIDALVHRVLDFHGRPPWLGARVNAAPAFPSPAMIQRIRGFGAGRFDRALLYCLAAFPIAPPQGKCLYSGQFPVIADDTTLRPEGGRSTEEIYR